MSMKNIKFVGDLKGEVVMRDWLPVPIANSVMDSSEPGATCHIYLTAQGLLFWRPNSAVAIGMADLKALVKEVEKDFCAPTSAAVPHGTKADTLSSAGKGAEES